MPQIPTYSDLGDPRPVAPVRPAQINEGAVFTIESSNPASSTGSSPKLAAIFRRRARSSMRKLRRWRCLGQFRFRREHDRKLSCFAFVQGGYANFKSTRKLKAKLCFLGRFCRKRLCYNPWDNPAQGGSSAGFPYLGK